MARAHGIARAALALATLSLVALVGLTIAHATTSAVRFRLDVERSSPEVGLAYTYDLTPHDPGFATVFVSDGEPGSSGSNLRVLEDGAPLGEAHSLHDAIRRDGGGRFSHWGRTLYLSSSDGSDPRTNGRTYELTAHAVVSPGLLGFFLLLLCLSGATVLSPWLQRRPLADGLTHRPRRTALVGVAASFLVAAVFHLCQRPDERPVILVQPDNGRTAGYVAARTHPERFAADPMLSRIENVDYYASILIPIVAAFERLTGDLGAAYTATYLPLVGLLAGGFFLLGRVLRMSIPASLLLAWVALSPVFVAGGEYWGAYFEPQPRMVSYASFPFLVAAFLCAGTSGRRPLALFALVGVSVYLYPVGAPTIALGLLLGALALRPEEIPWKRYLLTLGLGGLVFLAFALPYAIFLLGKTRGAAPADPAAHQAIARVYMESLGSFHQNAFSALGIFLKGGAGSGQGAWGWRWLVWLGGVIGPLTAVRHPEHGRHARFLLLLTLGIFLGSFGVTLVEQGVASLFGGSPPEIELIRNIRFLVPCLLLGTVWSLRYLVLRLSERSEGRLALAAPLITGLLVFGAIAWTRQHATPPMLRLRALLERNTDPLWPERAAAPLIRHARELPPGSVFLPLSSEAVGAALRYGALQPVAFLEEDVCDLYYSGRATGRWLHLRERLADVRSATDPDAAEAGLREIAQETATNYLVYRPADLSPALQLAVARLGPAERAAGGWILRRVAPRAP